MGKKLVISIVVVMGLTFVGLGSFFLHQQGMGQSAQLASTGRVTQPVDPSVRACISQTHVALSPLALPSQSTNDQYEANLYAFLRGFKYRQMNWFHDKRVRDTGDFLKGAFNGNDSNGTHPAVVVYYSPEVYCWMLADRKGGIPDGAMIIKEMYPPPSARYANQDLSQLQTPWWAVMVKDARGAYDGWYWGSVFDTVNGSGQRTALQDVDGQHLDEYPDSGFGSYCVRCHASAKSELTFSALENLEEDIVFPSGQKKKFGSPLQFRSDSSWKEPVPAGADANLEALKHSPHLFPMLMRYARADRAKASDFLENLKFRDLMSWDRAGTFFSLSDRTLQKFPPESLDHVPQSPEGRAFLTSDQCMGCHAGDNSPFGPNLYMGAKGFNGKGIDVSPWGEWRWSMMGLAGRDPVFHAQLETEMTIFQNAHGAFKPEVIGDTCLRCHGVMGQRQFHADLARAHADGLYSKDEIFKNNSYGALSRDGISCMVCHQMADNSKVPLKDIYTGQFRLNPPKDGMNQIAGPFDDVKVKPMQAALGVTPGKNEFLSSSRMCASCHTIYLPALDANGNPVKAGFEQSTYLEWVNSSYRDHGSTPKSCQECHMPSSYQGREDQGPLGMNFKIANIQDHDFPNGSMNGKPLQASNLLDDEDITIAKREPVRRHTLYGLNVFALEMFNQFSDILGRRPSNYMNYLETGAETAIENATFFAQRETAKVEVLDLAQTETELRFKVRVTNLTGHRFPSGVGFRRAFLDVAVNDGQATVWHSGGTNAIGEIVDGRGQVLETESLKNGQYQPHHQIITSDKQVQIYEELVQDDKKQFTTSFLSIFNTVKDNRLLPKGWSATPPTDDPTIDPSFFEATHPVGEAATDPDYLSGNGDDTVEYRIPISTHGGSLNVVAQLFYQATPPNYLRQRFATARGPATQRLYYLSSHLKTEQGPIQGWKLFIGRDQKSVP